MQEEQRLQGNRISLHLISVFSPKQEFEDVYQHLLNIFFITFLIKGEEFGPHVKNK